MGEDISNPYSDKELMFQLHKELLQLNREK